MRCHRGVSIRAPIKEIISRGENSVLAVIIVASLAGWLVAASFNPVSVPNWLIFGLLVAGGFMFNKNTTEYSVGGMVKYVGIFVGGVLILVSVAYQASDLLVNQSLGYLEQSKFESAEKTIKVAYFLNPTNVNTIQAKATIAMDKKDYPAIEQAGDMLLELHPRSAGMVRNAAAMYYHVYKNNPSEELKNKLYMTLVQYQTTNPNGAQTYQDSAYFLMLMKDYDLGIKLAQKYVLYAHNNPYSWILLAQLYSLNGDGEEALRALEKSFEFHPTLEMRIAVEKAREDVKNGGSVLVPFQFGDIGW